VVVVVVVVVAVWSKHLRARMPEDTEDADASEMMLVLMLVCDLE